MSRSNEHVLKSMGCCMLKYIYPDNCILQKWFGPMYKVSLKSRLFIQISCIVNERRTAAIRKGERI